MREIKFKLICAASENMGIGINGTLPWKLKSEMAFFTRMTTNTKDPDKKNAVVMGRKSWDSIPKKFKPLANRINIVLSNQNLDLGNEAIHCKSFDDLCEKLGKSPLKDQVEDVWVIGGSSVYQAAMESPNFYRLYLTKVKQHFECDTFFPQLRNDFQQIDDAEVPKGDQEENGIKFEYTVYEKQ